MRGIKKTVADHNLLPRLPDEQRITNYTLKMSSGGSLSIEDVKTRGNDPVENLETQRMLNQMLDGIADVNFRKEASELAAAMLEVHDDEHGDVEEYAHDILIESSAGQIFSSVKILSPDADDAAMKDLLVVGQEVANQLGSYFRSNFGLDRDFDIDIDKDGQISFDKSGFADKPGMADLINKTFDALNERMKSDDPKGVNETKFETHLPSELDGVLEKLCEFQEIRAKLHEPALKNATYRFTIRK